MKKLFGVLGWPVWHSRSPSMHNAAFDELGIDAVYVPFGVPTGRLAEAVRGLSALGVRGVNVTLPHKQTIMPFLDDIDADARAIGAVNTVAREGKRLIGLNTDAGGLVRALREDGFDPRGASAVVVGAGGAARAAVAGLARAGAARIIVCARKPERAEAIVEDLSRSFKKAKLSATGFNKKDKELAFRGASLLVQATSATLDDGPASGRFAASLPYGALADDALVTDIVYSPRRTAVLRAADEHGLRTVDGLGMLLHQGAIAFEKWTGKRAPIEVMREAL